MLSPSSKLPLQPYPHHCARHQDFCRCSAAAVPPPPFAPRHVPPVRPPVQRCRGLFFPSCFAAEDRLHWKFSPSLFSQLQRTQATHRLLLVLLFPPRTATSGGLHPKPKLRCPCSSPDRFCTVASCPTGQNSSTCKLFFFPQRRCLPVALLLAS
ncbi:hypothetical protein GQ55_4G223500 [Panicum hallii var. hallii]|uniref:Uncharacterized protein n=1 Tax=Panicum hallii var. hallii TaxID=1504633 RepID=A0A2T7DZD9_9POAL|nr:hypothetical protein GQ55_4G223500 [Panicum hallii var. hallii]